MALPIVLAASCGPGLPSEVPLGGTDSPTDAEARSGSRASDRTSSESAGVEGEGGASAADEADSDAEKGGHADETSEVAAAPTAPPPKDKKKPVAAAPLAPGAPTKPCDDTSGNAPACGELHSGACGNVFGPLCEQLGEALKPKIASAVVGCLVENNRRARCESIEECLKSGLEQACVSAPDREVCEKSFERCDPPSEGPWQDVDHCARGVASLKPASRTKVVECLQDNCDLETCFLKAGT